MFDMYKFIECVQENPAIWDNTCKDYMNKRAKETCWNNVAEDVFPDWLEMTTAQKESQIKEIKNKWRHIRDGYFKFTNYNRRNVVTKRRKYIYAQPLKFLENYVPTRRSYYQADEEEEQEDLKMNIEEQQVQKFEEVLVDTADLNEEEESTEPGSPISVASPPVIESNQRPTSAYMQQQSPTKQKVISGFQGQQFANVRRQMQELADPDTSFLFSILPDYKMLSYEQKLDFRMYALGFFKRINVRNSQAPSNANHDQ